MMIFSSMPKERNHYLIRSKQKSYASSLPEPHTNSGKGLGVHRDALCDLCHTGEPGQKYRWVHCRDVWNDIPTLFRNNPERVHYPTQKPSALIERIIDASTVEDSIVLDPFVGSGSSMIAASNKGRSSIGIDSNLGAIITTRGRLYRNKISTSIHTTCQNFEHSSPNTLKGTFSFNRPISSGDLYRNPNIKPTPSRKSSLSCKVSIEDNLLSLKEISSKELEKRFPNTKDRKAWIQSVTIDFQSHSGFFENPLLDQPRQTDLIKGYYLIPEDTQIIRIRISDLLSNIFEIKISR